MMALPVFAHHSAAGYDMKKTETAQATIKEFRWGAPHSSAIFIVKGPKGEPQELVTSSATPAMFLKQGFKPKDFKIGDNVEIMWHPTRNGTAGGILSRIKFGDGRVFNDLEFAAQINALEAKETLEREKE
jgi:hypothetical protein